MYRTTAEWDRDHPSTLVRNAIDRRGASHLTVPWESGRRRCGAGEKKEPQILLLSAASRSQQSDAQCSSYLCATEIYHRKNEVFTVAGKCERWELWIVCTLKREVAELLRKENLSLIYKFNGHRAVDLNSNIVDMMHLRVCNIVTENSLRCDTVLCLLLPAVSTHFVYRKF